MHDFATGLKTAFIVLIKAILDAAILFGANLDAPQIAALMGVTTALAAIVHLLVRFYTKAPMAVVAEIQARRGIITHKQLREFRTPKGDTTA